MIDNEFSQAFNYIVNDTLAQGIERNLLLTPAQIASQDNSRDRVKVVPRSSSSPHVSKRFFLPDVLGWLKSGRELHFGRKPKIEFSQAFNYNFRFATEMELRRGFLEDRMFGFSNIFEYLL